MITYKVLCTNDLNKEISLEELLGNEKILRVIKNEFAKGFRNTQFNTQDIHGSLKIETIKELHSFEVEKDDFADILVLAEEDAQNKKLIKKDCERIELVDIQTIDS